MVTASLAAPVKMVLRVVSGERSDEVVNRAYMQNTSIIAMVRNFCDKANCEDTTRKIGSVVNATSDMIFNTAMAT